MELLRAENITKSYRFPVLTNISFSLSQGECVGIVGENGCGKSTLLAILAGGMRADQGNLYIRKAEAFTHRKILSYAIGYVPQTDPIIEELTVKDNLKLWYSLSGRKPEEDMKPGGTLRRLGLLEVLRQRAGTLSGGMKRRLSIAGALASAAEILVLDEPSGGLDVVCRKEITEYISDYVKRGGGAVISTHNQEELDLCTKVFLLNGNTNKHTLGIFLER